MLPRSSLSLERLGRGNLLWAVLGALALGQLTALWLLCSRQVEQAEARRSEVMMQQVALTQCLRAGDVASCTRRIAEAPPPPREPASAMVDVLQGGVVPVGLSR
jgi:hypothetical protein